MEVWIPVLKEDGTKKTEQEIQQQLLKVQQELDAALDRCGQILASEGIRKIVESE